MAEAGVNPVQKESLVRQVASVLDALGLPRSLGGSALARSVVSLLQGVDGPKDATHLAVELDTIAVRRRDARITKGVH